MSFPQEKVEFKAEVVSHKNPFTTIPPQPAEKKPGQLPPDKIRQFFDEGYTVVEEFFTAAELQQCRDAIAEMVDSLAQKLYEAGKIKHLYEEYGLFQRLSQLEEDFHGANIILFKRQKMPKAFQDIWCNERVLNLMEQLIGPDIAGHPVWNLRTKTPRSTAVDIPWHQDSAYFSEDSYDHLIPTMWLPFLDAVPENGCMQACKNKSSCKSTYHHRKLRAILCYTPLTCAEICSFFTSTHEQNMSLSKHCNSLGNIAESINDKVWKKYIGKKNYLHS